MAKQLKAFDFCQGIIDKVIRRHGGNIKVFVAESEISSDGRAGFRLFPVVGFEAIDVGAELGWILKVNVDLTKGRPHYEDEKCS